MGDGISFVVMSGLEPTTPTNPVKLLVRLGTWRRPMSAVREALMLSWLACGLLMSAAWASFLGYQIFRLIEFAL